MRRIIAVRAVRENWRRIIAVRTVRENWRRIIALRSWTAALGCAAALLGLGVCSIATADYAPVTADHPLSFPADYGSHPAFRTEWWYVTGWLKTAQGDEVGFQITFFRTKPDIDNDDPSAFAPRQLLVAHCAISDPKRGRLWQDQRIRRAGMGLPRPEAATPMCGSTVGC